jgi:hypothetical protein
MKKLTGIVLLLAIIALVVVVNFLFSKFTPQNNPVITLSPTITQTSTQTSPAAISQAPSPDQSKLCKKEQLSTQVSSQGAAGNIYAKIEIANIGKSSCVVALGDTITVQLYAQNVTLHYQQTVPTDYLTLNPSEKVYSQIHYPNGAQCPSGGVQKQVSFLYFVPQTTYQIDLGAPVEKLSILQCTSQSEITTIDIWPLSKNPVTP